MTLFGYIQTSRHLQEGVAGMDPFSQELRLRESGVQRDNVYRDIGISGATGTVKPNTNSTATVSPAPR